MNIYMSSKPINYFINSRFIKFELYIFRLTCKHIHIFF